MCSKTILYSKTPTSVLREQETHILVSKLKNNNSGVYEFRFYKYVRYIGKF